MRQHKTASANTLHFSFYTLRLSPFFTLPIEPPIVIDSSLPACGECAIHPPSSSAFLHTGLAASTAVPVHVHGSYSHAFQSAGSGLAIPAWSRQDEICHILHRMSSSKTKGRYHTVVCSRTLCLNLTLPSTSSSLHQPAPCTRQIGGKQTDLSVFSAPKASLAQIVYAGFHKLHVNIQPPLPEGSQPISHFLYTPQEASCLHHLSLQGL